MIDIRQSAEYANYLAQIGWTVKRKNGVNYFLKKLPLIGSILKIQRPKTIDFGEIEKLAQKYRAFQIILEPNLTPSVRSTIVHNSLLSQGFKLSQSPYLSTKTLQIDLTQSKEQIFAKFKKDAKSALRLTNNLKLKTNNLKNLEEFRKNWKRAVGWKRYVPPLVYLVALKNSFKKNSLFILDENKNSGAIFLIADKIGYYWQAFTSRAGRDSLAQYQIVWQGILWAKKQGCKIFNFEGIYDPRFPNKSWLGFTHFKKSFGGYEVEYPGCYTKWLLPKIL